MTGIGVRVGGWAVEESFDLADLEWSTRWQPTGGSGCWEASWTMVLPRTVLPPTWLRRGALVELVDGMTCFWSGILDIPAREGDTVTLTAHGLARDAAAFMAWDNGTTPTTKPSVAVAHAIVRGWAVTAGSGLSTTAMSTQTTNTLNKVSDVLDAQIDGTPQRWTVWADGVLSVESPATTPVWRLSEDLALFGAADDDWVETGALRYFDATAGQPLALDYTNTAAQAALGHSEAAADITGLGPMTAAAAQAKLKAAVDASSARLGFTNALNVGLEDLTTLAGTPVRATQIKAGQMVRGLGLNDPTQVLGATQTVDFLLGEVRCTAGSGEIYLAPQGLVSRGYAGWIEDQVASEDQMKDFLKGIVG